MKAHILTLSRIRVDLIRHLGEVSTLEKLDFQGKKIDKNLYCDGVLKVISCIDDVFNDVHL